MVLFLIDQFYSNMADHFPNQFDLGNLMQKHNFITMKQASSDDIFETIPSSTNFIM